MKNILILIVFIMSLAVASAQTKKGKLYPFKSAVVEYVYEGNTTGRQVLYIDNYGWLQSEITQTTSKSFGQTSKEDKVKVTKDFDIYQWDNIEHTGVKLRNTLAEDLMNDPDFDPEEFGKRTMEALDFKKAGTETINGKPCEVWKGLAGSSTIWIWNSLALKTEIKMLGTKTIWTANVVKINEGVPSGKFNLPSNITFTDMGNTDPLEMMQKTQKQEGSGDSEEAPVKSLKELNGFLKKLNNQ